MTQPKKKRHKQGKKNAKPMLQKMYRKHKNTSRREALECKKINQNAEKITRLSTKTMQKKGHKKCNKKKQNKYDQKRSGLCLCMFVLFICDCFTCVLHGCVFPWENAKNIENIRKQQRKTVLKKRT